MIVTVFELEPKEERRTLLEKFFRQYVSPSAVVKAAPSQDALRYIKLLQAAIPPDKGIQLSSEEFGIYSYRMYIKAYFTIRNMYGLNYRSFLGNDVSKFFPAVAVQERMVFVPVGLAQMLVEGFNEFMPPFSALKEGGVLELDYSNEVAIEKGVQSLAQIIRREFIDNLKAYSEFENLAVVNLQKIADDLNADVDYVRHILKGNTRPFEGYRQVNVVLTPDSGQVNNWTKATLKLSNQSDYDLANVLVRFKGPISVLPEPLETSIPAHSTTEETISIKPLDPGPFPIEISCVLPEDQSLANWIRGQLIWFQSTT